MIWTDSTISDTHTDTRTHQKVYLLFNYNHFESHACDRYFVLNVSVIIFYIEGSILSDMSRDIISTNA